MEVSGRRVESGSAQGHSGREKEFSVVVSTAEVSMMRPMEPQDPQNVCSEVAVLSGLCDWLG